MKGRDPGEMLVDHVVYRCNDLEEFHSHIVNLEGNIRRRVLDEGPVEIELRSASLDMITVGVFYSNVSMSTETDRGPDRSFLLQFPYASELELEVMGRKVVARPGMGLVISPSVGPARRVSRPGWVMSLMIDNVFVRTRLSDRLGYAPSDSLMFTPLVTDAARDLHDYCLLILDAVEGNTKGKGSPVARILETGLVDLMLDYQPHLHSQSLANVSGASRSRRIQIVEDHLAQHCHEPITIEDLAAVAGCSIRSLQMAFNEYCGISPMDFLKRHRLTRARLLLENAKPGTTVGDVALRAGFTHLSRFASSYRERYGELPSETIKRVIPEAPPGS